jgi:beta-phosphoglucomutase-like phosphatase (HAD superfamily)
MSDDNKKKEEPKPFTKGWKPPGRKSKCTNEEIIRALEKTRGHIADAARLLGYTPGTLRKKICETPELRQAKEEIVETRLDDAEQKLQQHIYEKDNVQALLEYLKAVGRRRGYGNAPIDVNLNGKVEHSLDSEIAKGLVDKFQKMLDEDAENEQQS